MKILIIHTFGLGDMIMFTPALQMIKNNFPEAKIDFLIFQKSAAAPIRNCKFVNKIFYTSLYFSDMYHSLKKLRKINYDYVMHTSGTSVLKISILMFFVKAKNKIGEYSSIKIPWYQNQIKKQTIHRADSNLMMIKTITHDSNNYTPFYCLNHSNMVFAENFLINNKIENDLLIGIHPGCNKKFKQKRWEVWKYISLIKLLLKNNDKVRIFVFVGPYERQEGKLIKTEILSVYLVEDDIDNVAALIGKMNLMITNDSGLGHIASCFDNKILTIISKSSYADMNKIQPYNKKQYILDFRKDARSNEVSEVYENIKVILKDKINE